MSFLDEIAAKLVADGVGTLGGNIYISSSVAIPSGNGPYLTIIETGGMKGSRVQNQASVRTQNPTAQIAVRAKHYPIARTMAKAAYDSLDGTFNTSLSGTFYQSITLRQEPTDIGLDEAGRGVVVFNIEAEKNPS